MPAISFPHDRRSPARGGSASSASRVQRVIIIEGRETMRQRAARRHTHLQLDHAKLTRAKTMLGAESTGSSRHPVHLSLQTQSALAVARIVRSFRTPLVSDSHPCLHHNGGASPNNLARAVRRSLAFSNQLAGRIVACWPTTRQTQDRLEADSLTLFHRGEWAWSLRSEEDLLASSGEAALPCRVETLTES
jgi:hypothetical protein